MGDRVEQLGAALGYDHCYAIRGTAGTLRPAAKVVDPTRRTRDGSEYHSAWHAALFRQSSQRRCALCGGYGPRDAMCVETQQYPNTPNIESFPTTLLRPGQMMKETTVHRFSVQK